MQASEGAYLQDKDKQVLVNMVKSLLSEKPVDPVPYMFAYIKQHNAGNANPTGIDNNQVNEIKNLKKQVEYLQSQLDDENDGTLTESDEDEEEEDVDHIAKRQAKAKKQRQAVSAEVYGEWNKKEDFNPKVVPKSAEIKAQLKSRLLQAFMFNALDDKELEIVIDAIEEVKYQGGEDVIKEGDQGDCMYVLESGSLDCTKVFAGNSAPTHLKTYAPGEGFGELALLYNAPRAATITAKSESVAWRLDRDTFNHIVKDAAQRKRDKYDKFLQSVQILQNMDPYERSKIGDALKEEKFAKGDYVIKEGDIGNKFFIISEGEAIALKKLGEGEPTKVMDYKKGMYFGERALLTNDARAASIQAVSDLVCVSLERDTFNRVLGSLDEILKRNMDVYEKYK